MPSHPLARRASFAVVAAIVWSTPVVSPASAQTLPAGFQETIIFTGLVEPTVVRFAADGRIFVAEKRGVVKLFDGLSGTDYGEVLTTDNAIHDLSPRITAKGVSVVAYSCCNGKLTD